MPAFITDFGICLPNESVTNAQMENLLGLVDGRPSKLKDIILARNGIKTRYYAIDPATGRQTHSNAQLAADAVQQLAQGNSFRADEIDLLACGTSSPDQVVPSHAAMVHGLSGLAPCEVVSTAGVCCSSMAALKYAVLSVSAGESKAAVVTGSELASSVFRGWNFRLETARTNPARAFEQEFLRWMLSDGAAALRVAPKPKEHGLSLRIDWLDMVSFANELETCMYSGAVKHADGSLHSWREAEDPSQLHADGYFNLTQDLKVLEKYLLPVAFRRSFERVRERRDLSSNNIDWLLVHMSSEYFRHPIYAALAEAGSEMPWEKWFTNLATRGNTGSASCFLMLEELANSGRLKSGDRIICVVPESARFTFAYMQLTVV